MLASVSCISARLIQIRRLPTRCTGAETRFERMVLWKTNQSPGSAACGLPPVNKTLPRASKTSTRSMSRSSSSRSAIEATAALLPELKRGRQRGAGDLAQRLLARASRSASSFCATVA